MPPETHRTSSRSPGAHNVGGLPAAPAVVTVEVERHVVAQADERLSCAVRTLALAHYNLVTKSAVLTAV
jgi:hypothetical protein